MSVTYQLRPEYAGSYGGGVISYGPYGLSFDVGAALTAGGGSIVVFDAELADALDDYKPLYRSSSTGGLVPSPQMRLRSLSVASGANPNEVVFESHLAGEQFSRLEMLADGTMRWGNGTVPTSSINTTALYQSESRNDASLATDFHGLFNTPSKAGISTLADYNDSSSTSTTIYQLAGGVYNTGTRPAVAVGGFARGKQVWGLNLVVMADGSGSEASGAEIDFQIVTAGLGVANGLELHAHGAAGNPGRYLGMRARAGAQDPSPRVGIQIAINGTDQPLWSTGTIFETSGAIVTTHGIDFHSAAFIGEAAYFPLNKGSAGGSIGVKIECSGGLANTGSMLQFSAADGSSTAQYGIRFATAAGGPVISSGTLIYVDGGTFGKFADLTAASFAASGAIAMGDNNLSFGTATGCKIGTSTSQKLAFYNSTPIAQFSTTATSAGFTAGAGTTVTHLSTFTGNTGSVAYTLGDVVRALKQLGLIAA